MKNFINDIKKDPKGFLKRNSGNIGLILISIITLVVGIKAVGALKSVLIVGFLDLLLFGIPFVQNLLEKRNGDTIRIKTKYEEPKGESMTKTKVFKPKSEKPVKEKKSKKEKEPKEKKPKKKRSVIGTIFKVILILIFLGIIAVVVAAFLFFSMIVREAPEFDPKNLYKQESTIIYDADGKVITKLGVEKREKITYNDLPEVLINAIVATEDSKFFQHKGVDLKRFIVASTKQVLHMPGAGGASTITMQISKNAFTSKEASGWEGIKRKFTDIYVSMFQIEKKYSKKEIMEFYVNSYYLGSGAYGVEQASQTYFGKSVKDITLPEAAIIAGLFQSPGKYSPITYPENAKARMHTVLYLMERHGYITAEERAAADKIQISELINQSKQNTSQYAYQDFIDTVVEEVKKDTGHNPYTTPMKIYTTMNRSMQEKIDDIMMGKTYDWENDVVQAGIAIVDPKTGEMPAIGAGRNRTGEGTYNHATMINRQIGSTAKPLYDYAPAIEWRGASSYTPVYDEPYHYSNGVEINNWDGAYAGWQTSRVALAGSRNIPALKAFQANPKDKYKDYLSKMGLHPEDPVHEAHAIGGYNGEYPLSMASAYSTFTNGGTRVTPHSYRKIIYRDTGETVEKDVKKIKVISEEAAYITYDMLVTTSTQALGWYANLNNGISFAAKTGTSNFSDETKRAHGLWDDAINDLWVVGGTDQYMISVWYGYDEIYDYAYTHFGSTQHERLWQAVANNVLTRAANIPRPGNVVEVTLENFNAVASLPSPFTPNDFKTTELFIKGTEPTETSRRFEQLGNVKNLTGTVTSTGVKLSWTALPTPYAIDKAKQKEAFKSIITDENTLNWWVDDLIAFQGYVTYDVYEQRGGELVKLGNTDKTTFDVTLTSTSSASTFMVKSVYSRFKNNASTGTTVTVDTSSVEIKPTFELLGNNTETIAVGSSFDAFMATKGPVVYDNLVAVTSTITTSIKDSAGHTYTKDNVTAEAGTYTVVYTVKYKTYTETLSQIVIVK